jgi:hypothetical protein
MTLNVHKVDDRTIVNNGAKPLHVPPGWQIADGSADDVRVCVSHPWQTYKLVFADGLCCGTTMGYSHCSMHPQPSCKQLIFRLTPENSGKTGRRVSHTGCARGENNA